MLPFKLIYHEGYDLHLGTHVFPSQKFRMVRDALVAKGCVDAGEILTPQPASDEDVLLVHTREWVEKLRHDRLTATERMRLEIPYSEQTVRAFWLAAGGWTWPRGAHCGMDALPILAAAFIMHLLDMAKASA